MRRFARLALALAFSLPLAAPLLVSPALARPLQGQESRQMQSAVDGYLRAIGRGEASQVVASLPPRVKNIFAGSAGIEASKLDATLVQQTSVMLKSAKFANFKAEYQGLEAQDAKLSDGTEVTWAIVPTSFSSEGPKGKLRNEQPLLVISEGGRWYMMRIEGAQSQQLVSLAYPFLAQVRFPESRSAAMK